MLRNYLITALRHFTRQKVYSVINVLGLAMSTAFCFLAFLYVQHEWSYDQFHKHADQIYRLISFRKGKTGDMHMLTILPENLGPLLKGEFPQLDRVVRIVKNENVVIRTDERRYREDVLFIDKDFFELFSFPLSQGNIETFRTDPQSLVLSESVAQNLFPGENPIGKEIVIASHHWKNEPKTLTVGGVALDPPSNSSIQFKILLPYKLIPPRVSGMPDSPMNDPAKLNFFLPRDYIFVQLQARANLEDLNNALPAFIKTHRIPGIETSLQFQPLTDVHFDQRPTFLSLMPSGNPVYAYILSAIAGMVLLIASVNFMNLATARFSTRAREVGIRKVVGAQRTHLMWQFWGESIVMTAIAMILGISLAELYLPTFNSLIQVRLLMTDMFTLSFVLFAFVLMAFIALISGLYPAVNLSGFQAVAVLKDKKRLGSSGPMLRALIIVQFVGSILLVTITAFMFLQVSFIKTKDLGIDGDQIAVISTEDLLSQSDMRGENLRHLFETFQQQLNGYPDILGVTRSDLFSDIDSDYQFSKLSVRPPEGDEFYIPYIDIEENFLQVLGIELLHGQQFSHHTINSQHAVLVNETLVKQLGLSQSLGHQVPLTRRILDGTNINKMKFRMIRNPEIVGIVKDFHVQSLHQAVPPLIMFLKPEVQTGEFLVRIRSERMPETLDFMARQWKRVFGITPFNYTFLDERFDHLYQREERWSLIVSYASIFALVVACLGVLGLTAIAISRRTKEFGIRKVFGASTKHIVTLLATDFILLITIATLIAWPLAYYAASQWLQNFAYRINLGFEIFFFSGAMTIIIVLATIMILTIRVTRCNPVEILRYE